MVHHSTAVAETTSLFSDVKETVQRYNLYFSLFTRRFVFGFDAGHEFVAQPAVSREAQALGLRGEALSTERPDGGALSASLFTPHSLS